MARPKPKLQRVGHSSDQHHRLEKATMRTSLTRTEHIEAAANFLLELAEGKNLDRYPDLLGYSEVVRRGGTIASPGVAALGHASKEFRSAIAGIETNFADITGARPKNLTLKSYSPKTKHMGLAPHRDSNFRENTKNPPSLVGMLSLVGVRDSALWVVPQNIILPGTDEDYMRTATRESCLVSMRGYSGPQQIELTPFDVSTQVQGDATFVDERPARGGVWQDPKLGQVAIWHSVYAQFPDQPQQPSDEIVVSLIARTTNPSATIA